MCRKKTMSGLRQIGTSACNLSQVRQSRVARSFAVERIRKAADQGDAGAQNNLGLMYQVGHGVPRDYAEALKWYRLAAEQGAATAQTALGLMYQCGHGGRTRALPQAGQLTLDNGE
jgi:TPR repeat protein